MNSDNEKEDGSFSFGVSLLDVSLAPCPSTQAGDRVAFLVVFINRRPAAAALALPAAVFDESPYAVSLAIPVILGASIAGVCPYTGRKSTIHVMEFIDGVGKVMHVSSLL